MENSEFDIAVIGAGLSGIAFARFYLDVHPETRLVIIEKESEIGGTWSRSRTFDTFWTQSPMRTTSFADAPLTLPEDAPRLYDTFPARYVSQYIEDYVRNHVYSDRPLCDRIWLKTEVASVKRISSGWELDLEGPMAQSIRCSKLAVASGLTSQPNLPNFPRHPDWTSPILHHRDFGIHSQAMLSATSPYKHITVLGGGKSAADMVYAAINADPSLQVNWIVRRKGEGPGFFLHAAPSGRYRNAAEPMLSQNATQMNPSGFRTLLPNFQSLHREASGRVNIEERILAADERAKGWANYRGRENALPNFQKLEPSASLFWSSGPPGMMPHDNFWDLVSRHVNVYRSDPVGTTASSIILEDGTEVPTDVLFAGTGWDTSCRFMSPAQACAVGLPHEASQDGAETTQTWQRLMEEADESVIGDYPILATPPSDRKASLTPARLYQGIAPLTDPSIVFLGRTKLPNGFFAAEAGAIWATAYWSGRIHLPPLGEAQSKVAYMNAFCRRRYPCGGGDGLNFYKDLIWYVDGLLTEAGLTSHRKGWWVDWDEPFVISDLRDCKEEYLAKYGAEGGVRGHSGAHY